MNLINAMTSARVIGAKDEENDRRSQNLSQLRSCNWKMSYNVIDTGQRNIVFHQKSSFVLYSHRGRLQTVCPRDVKLLKEHTSSVKEETAQTKIDDVGDEEYEPRLDRSDLMLGPPKLRVWDQYKKLLQSAQPVKKQMDFQSLLTEVTCLQKVRVDGLKLKTHTYLTTQAKRSIIRMELQETILVADSNYVQFRNYKLNKHYQKTIKLQNVTVLPAKFRLEGRSYRSYFQVSIAPVMESKSIIPPGMQLKLIVSFYCDMIDEPEEILVVNVQHGKSLIIRLHGVKDPPVLLELDEPRDLANDSNKIRKSSIASQSEPGIHPEEHSTTDSNTTTSTDSYDFTFLKSRYVMFDCKKSFVGEEIRVPMRFKNNGGEGRFFIMGEIDWCSMYIEDITSENTLRLHPFTIWPAYFELKPQEEITFFAYFRPDSYGIHVDQLYILCDNCTMLATEIIGDGLLYESNFIQLSKVSTSLLRNNSTFLLNACSNVELHFFLARAPPFTSGCTLAGIWSTALYLSYNPNVLAVLGVVLVFQNSLPVVGFVPYPANVFCTIKKASQSS